MGRYRGRRRGLCWLEPWFFLFFGLFHLHRLWALVDRERYAGFWLGVLEKRGPFYIVLMGLLVMLCLAGLSVFFRRWGENARWRWLYVFGGGYVLWDMFAIAAGLDAWKRLLYGMYDTEAPWWNLLWGGFVIFGALSCWLGAVLLYRWRGQEKA